MIIELEHKHTKKPDLKEIFRINKPVTAMLHLAPLPGQPDFISLNRVADQAARDIDALQNGGVNGILIENWNEDSCITTTNPRTEAGMLAVIFALKKQLSVPFGVNVLNNDYAAGFRIASQTGASFVELDVLVDRVKSDFHYSQAGQDHPFEINVDIKDVQQKRREYKLDNTLLWVFIQPKHYLMIDPHKTIETSALEAKAAGADGILITKATGTAPDIDRIKRVKNVLGNDFPVGIGSGFSTENAAEFMPSVDFVVVGSATKVGGDVNNPVEPERVFKLMDKVKRFQY
jgi:membrane complex biogenesis BtpA family protein